jgi:DNA-binding MarR family transcriptional regulator
LGLVQKNENDSNKRKLSITLSDAGMKLIQSIDVADENFKSVLSHLSPSEVENLNILFDKVFVRQLPQGQTSSTD